MLSPFRAPARVLDLILAGDLVLLLDDRILAEYREVAARPKFGFDRADVDRLLATLDALAEHVAAPPLAVRLPDPADLPFLEVSAAGAADALVTGNARHFEALTVSHALPVMVPGELMDRLAGRG